MSLAHRKEPRAGGLLPSHQTNKQANCGQETNKNRDTTACGRSICSRSVGNHSPTPNAFQVSSQNANNSNKQSKASRIVAFLVCFSAKINSNISQPPSKASRSQCAACVGKRAVHTRPMCLLCTTTTAWSRWCKCMLSPVQVLQCNVHVSTPHPFAQIGGLAPPAMISVWLGGPNDRAEGERRIVPPSLLFPLARLLSLCRFLLPSEQAKPARVGGRCVQRRVMREELRAGTDGGLRPSVRRVRIRASSLGFCRVCGTAHARD